MVDQRKALAMTIKKKPPERFAFILESLHEKRARIEREARENMKMIEDAVFTGYERGYSQRAMGKLLHMSPPCVNDALKRARKRKERE